MKNVRLGLGVLWLLSGIAMAQEPETEPAPVEGEIPTIPVEAAPAEPAPASGSVVLDAIEVTAQRRKERLVDVPIAVTAMTQDQIESRRIDRLDDLNSLAPGLQISRSPANTTISQLAIRGSSQINPAIYWDPAVGVYLDGVYIGKGQGSIFNVVDLSGIEVLRGPQGTLYGRNTIAGTVNLISRAPTGIFSGRAGVEYGNYNNWVYRASMDLPRLAIADITLSARSERRDPWIETTPTSPVDGMNDRKNEGAHLGAVIDIADRVQALYHLDWSDTDQTNQFLQLVRSDDPNLQDYITTTRRATADINAPSAETSRLLGHSLVLSWDAAEWLTVKSISGQRDVKWVDKLDLDGSPRDVAHSERHTDYSQFSQDFNFSGNVGDWKYTAGAYYFKDDGYTVNPIYVELSGAPLDFDSRYGTHTRALAGYGQVDWTALERLTLSAGARYTSEKKDLDRVYGYRALPPDPAPAPPYTYVMPEGYKAPGKTFTDTSPTVAAAWRFSDSLNTYVRYAEGFKSGGFNGEYSNIQGSEESNKQETNTPFLPEKQKSVELGLKSTLWDNRAQLNVAAFQNKLDNLQVSIFTASGAAASVIRNAGKATVRGLEVEAVLAPFAGTRLSANYAWLDPVYDTFVDSVCTGPNSTNCGEENVANNRAFVHAPKGSWNLVLDQEIWNTRWGLLRATLDYVWTDRFFTYPYQLTVAGDPNCVDSPTARPCYDDTKQSAPNTDVSAYGLLNARLALTGIPLGGARLGEIALWGRNVMDEDAATNYIDFGPGFDNLTIANFVEPAAFGISALFRW